MKKIVITSVIFLLGIGAIAQTGADLKLNLEKNKVYRFKSTSDQTVSQTVNGVQQNTNTKNTSTFSIKMVDATPQFIVAEVRFDTLVTNTNTMGKMTTITSASEGDIKSAEMADVMSCIMNRLSKNALYVKMDASGKVLEIVNAKMLSGIVMKDTGLITGQQAPVIKSQIRNTMDEKALKSQIEVFTYNLPGKEVKAGDKWDINMNLTAGGLSMDISTNYVLNTIKDNTAGITNESYIKASDNAAPLEMGGAKIAYGDIKGMGKADMTMDTATGLINMATSKVHIAGTLDVSVQSMNLQIPMEINGESKISAIR